MSNASGKPKSHESSSAAIAGSSLHPHEPEIAPTLDNEGRCLVCRLLSERDLARNLAKGMFSMIDRETWRGGGGDDGQGHYEGDYYAAKIEEEIKSWES